MNNRIAIFVDGPSFLCMQKDGLGWFVDPQKIITWAKRRFDGEIVDTRYYDSIGFEINKDQDEKRKKERQEKLEKFHYVLPQLGYSVHKKNVKNVFSATDSWVEDDVIISMMLDIWESKDKFDTLILVSGDGDFEEVVERLRSKRVIVLATDSHLSHSLRAKVGQRYIDFNNIQVDVKKDTQKNDQSR